MKLILYFFLYATLTFSQTDQSYSFKQIQTSANTVSDILKDKQGFMWFTTWDGLNRYDGYELRTFYHDASDSTTLSSNGLSTLLLDLEGQLWIGSYRDGLNLYLPKLQRFKRLIHQKNDSTTLSSNAIVKMCLDNEGFIWIATRNGLNKFNPKTFRNQRITKEKSGILADHFGSLAKDEKGQIWIGTSDDGLHKYNPKTKQYTHFLRSKHSPIPYTHIFALTSDNNGTLWAAAPEIGVFSFNEEANKRQDYSHNPNDPTSLGYTNINVIRKLNDGSVWMGTQNNGISIFHPHKKSFTQLTTDPLNPNSLRDNDILDIYQDNTGLIWVATWNAGVLLTNPKQSKFPVFRQEKNNPNSLNDNVIYPVYQDSKGYVWLGTNTGGLNRFHPETHQFKHYMTSTNPNSISHNRIRAILEDRHGYLWVGTAGGGLNRFNYTNETFKRYTGKTRKGLPNEYIYHMATDTMGNLWVGTVRGFVEYDKKSDSFISHTLQTTSGKPLVCMALCFDSQNNLWIGSSNDGLYIYNPKLKTAKHLLPEKGNPHTLIDKFIPTIFKDKQGQMWTGSIKGLSRFNASTETFTHITKKEGLANSVIYSFEEDLHGNYWVSTNEGLSRINAKTGEIENFTVEDGLQHKEFSGFGSEELHDGRLLFAGTKGFNLFHPDSIRPNPFIPNIVLTELQLFNSPVRIGEKNSQKHPILTSDISLTKTIHLSYKENVITFSFSALNYLNSHKNKYSYKMEGFDKSWQPITNRRFATYTNLDHGKYTFRVKGSNNDGIWNEEGTSVRVIITPPFWDTIWFKLIVFTLMAIGAVSFPVLKVQAAQKRQRELEDEVEKRTEEIKKIQTDLIESEKLSSIGQMVSGIAHEMNTPLGYIKSNLFSINRFLNAHKDMYLNGKEKRLNKILKVLDSSARGVNELSEIVQGLKTYTDIANIGEKENNLSDALEATLIVHNGLLRESHILLKKEIKPDVMFRCDIGQMSLIFSHLIKNACYSMKQKGEHNGEHHPLLYVLLTEEYGNIEISFTDNGLGIEKEIQSKVFDPFFTTKPTGEGKGLGLSVSKNFVNHYKGQIFLTSNPKTITTFRISLPVDRFV